MNSAVLQDASPSAAYPFRWTARVVAQLTVLALAAYVYVLAEMAPIGATPAIASDLGVREAHVGMLTAAYAFITVVTTLPLVRFTARWPRRRILVLTLTCLSVSQVLSVIAPNLETLIVSRVLCAITHGLMWSIIVPIGARLVPPTHTGRAATAVYVGTSAALIVGNPLTTAMSEAWGWRPTVAAMAVAATVTTLTAQILLPTMAVRPGDANLVSTRKPLLHRNKRLTVLCALTFIGVTAHFVSYTYIVPIIRDVVHVGGSNESWVLAGYGVVGLVTMGMLARALDHRVRAAAAGGATILCLAFWCLAELSGTGAGLLAVVVGVGAIMVWGASAALLPPLLQSAAIRTSSDDPERASALYVTTFQVGIMTGSVVGGLAYAQSGIAAVVATSSVLFAVALVGVLLRADAFAPTQLSPPPIIVVR
jgi:predicted MFS family arabinose efflux permease